MNGESISVSPYIGRFAPSPSGPLHFGSLVAAAGSYLDAKHHGGLWWVRMEDLDTPRNMPGAADDILRTLERYALHWDGPVWVQSERVPVYEQVLHDLQAQGVVFACGCTRKEISDSVTGHVPGTEMRYPGTCRTGLAPGRAARAWRFAVAPGLVGFDERIQAPFQQDVAASVGDFVLRRADGIVAYQLAVVVDDAAQGISHVVRGADLLDSTPRQVRLQQALHYPTPHYAHLPVAANAQGEKLSKQTKAKALHGLEPVQVWRTILNFLGQSTPPDGLDLMTLRNWAVNHWNISRVPAQRTLPAPDFSV